MATNRTTLNTILLRLRVIEDALNGHHRWALTLDGPETLTAPARIISHEAGISFIADCGGRALLPGSYDLHLLRDGEIVLIRPLFTVCEGEHLGEVVWRLAALRVEEARSA